MSYLYDLFNVGISASLTGAVMISKYYWDKNSMALVKKVKTTPLSEDKLLDDIFPQIKSGLEEFIKMDTDVEISKRGPVIDIASIIDARMQRELGVVKRDIFRNEKDVPKKYQFIINYSVAAQKGLENTQEYVVPLTCALSKAILSIEQEVAINAIGKDFTVVKKYSDELDFNRIKNVRITTKYNFCQATDMVAYLASITKEKQVVVINLNNSNSPINDIRYKSSYSFPQDTIVLTFNLNEGKYHNNANKIVGSIHNNTFSQDYFIKNMSDLGSGFLSFLQTAKKRVRL